MGRKIQAIKEYLKETFGSDKLRDLTQQDYIKAKRKYDSEIREIEGSVDDRKTSIERREEDLGKLLQTYGRNSSQVASAVNMVKTDEQAVHVLNIRHGRAYKNKANLEIAWTIRQLVEQTEGSTPFTDNEVEDYLTRLETDMESEKYKEHIFPRKETDIVKYDQESLSILDRVEGRLKGKEIAKQKDADLETTLVKDLEEK